MNQDCATVINKGCIAITNHYLDGYAMKVTDAVVFVTGANRGLGLAIAREARKQGAKKSMLPCAKLQGFKKKV
nr:hypothetical protein [Acinetobacter tandoii]